RQIVLESPSHGLLRGGRLVPQARPEGGQDRFRPTRLRLAELQELRIPESRRERAVEFPQEPRVLGRREVSGRDSGGVDLAEGMAEETGVRARRDEERPIREVR